MYNIYIYIYIYKFTKKCLMSGGLVVGISRWEGVGNFYKIKKRAICKRDPILTNDLPGFIIK